MRYFHLIVATLCLMPAAQAQDRQSQADGDPHANLETLTITARPPGSQSLEHTAQPVSILAGERLERRQANTLGETLSREPGVTGSYFGAGASRPIIRGLDGPRIRMLQDGIDTLDVSTISVDHPVPVEPFQAEQIEIMRGPATLLYGNSASGGLVNVVTGRIPETLPTFAAEVLGQYESANNGRTLGLRARGSIDQLAFHFDGLERDSQDYEAPAGEIDNSFVESSNYNFGTSWVGSHGFIGLSFGRFETTYGIPVDPDEPDEEAFIDQEQDRFDFAARIDKPLTGLRNIHVRAGYNDYRHIEFEGPGEPGTVFDNEAWEGRIEFNHAAIGPLMGTLGVQLKDRDFSAVGDEAFVPPAEEHSIGVFVFEDSDWRDWHFEGGARFDHQTIEPVAATGNSDIVHNTYSVSGGVLWHFTPGYAVGLNFSRAQRAPAIEELLAEGPHLATGTFETGDPDLDQETANSVDLSLRKTDGRLNWRANVFVNYIEDFIFLLEQDRNNDGIADKVDDEGNPGGELLVVDFTQKDALFFGLEGEATFSVFDDHRGSLAARLFGDWVRAHLDGGDDLPRITPARLGLAFDYHRGRIQADIETMHVFEQNATATLESETDGYTLLAAGASYTLARAPAETRLFLRGTNLFDEDARRHTSFLKDRAPLPGRSGIVGIRVSF